MSVIKHALSALERDFGQHLEDMSNRALLTDLDAALLTDPSRLDLSSGIGNARRNVDRLEAVEFDFLQATIGFFCALTLCGRSRPIGYLDAGNIDFQVPTIASRRR